MKRQKNANLAKFYLFLLMIAAVFFFRHEIVSQVTNISALMGMHVEIDPEQTIIVYDKNMESNINAFARIDSQLVDTSQSLNYFCAHRLYGMQEPYMYTWIYCYGYPADVLPEIDSQYGSGLSTPARFEYDPSSLEIIDVVVPDNGALYEPSMASLFGGYKDIQPSRVELDSLALEVVRKVFAARAAKSHGNIAATETIKFSRAEDGWYLAFIYKGSGLPLTKAECFTMVQANDVWQVMHRDTYVPDVQLQELATANNFLPERCGPRAN